MRRRWGRGIGIVHLLQEVLDVDKSRVIGDAQRREMSREFEDTGA